MFEQKFIGQNGGAHGRFVNTVSLQQAYLKIFGPVLVSLLEEAFLFFSYFYWRKEIPVPHH